MKLVIIHVRIIFIARNFQRELMRSPSYVLHINKRCFGNFLILERFDRVYFSNEIIRWMYSYKDFLMMNERSEKLLAEIAC